MSALESADTYTLAKVMGLGELEPGDEVFTVMVVHRATGGGIEVAVAKMPEVKVTTNEKEGLLRFSFSDDCTYEVKQL